MDGGLLIFKAIARGERPKSGRKFRFQLSENLSERATSENKMK